MRKPFKMHAIVAVLLLFLCTPSGNIELVEAASVMLSSKAFTLEVNHYKTLHMKGTNKKVTWSSSNPKIAYVSSGGRVTAKAPGTATIYATVAGKKLSAKVTVIKLSASSLSLTAGSKKALKVNGTSSKVTWSSGNKAIVTVSTTGTITAKAPGTATIYATVLGKKLSAKVTVMKLSASSLSLTAGSKKTLKVSGTSSKVTWSSSDKAIATVSTTGTITAKAPGTATIYASVLGKKLSGKVTVIKLSTSAATLTTGTSKTLKVYGTTSKVTWSSSNKTIATVSTAGKVTAKAPGSAKIYAFVGGLKLTSTITVKKVANTSTPAPTSVPKATPTVAPSPTKKPIPTPTVTPSPESTNPAKEAEGTYMVGYYAAWSKYSGYTADMIDSSKLTHINYAFANIGSDLKIALGYPDIDASNISKLNKLKERNPSLKTLISVGGWSWSGRFSDVALTEKSREIFAQSVVDFVVKYGFDGVDIDWEYPVSGGLSTNVKRPEDKHNFYFINEDSTGKVRCQGKDRR